MKLIGEATARPRDGVTKGLRLSLAAVLLYASISKFWQRPDERTIWGQTAAPLQAAVATAEFTVALWLGSGVGLRLASISLLVLLSLFSGVITVEIGSPHPRPCGCGLSVLDGGHGHVRRSLAASLVRNLCLMAAAGYVFVSAGSMAARPAAHPGGAGADPSHGSFQ